MKHRAYLSIGEVLGLLVDEFPDVTISKIRFLETQGLVEPERTASGYRKFSDEHVERLRYVMREQKDNYLPLKVIKDRLDGEDGTPLATPRPIPTGAAWATIDTAHAPDRVEAGSHPSAHHSLDATRTVFAVSQSVDLVEVLFGDSPRSAGDQGDIGGGDAGGGSSVGDSDGTGSGTPSAPTSPEDEFITVAVVVSDIGQQQQPPADRTASVAAAPAEPSVVTPPVEEIAPPERTTLRTVSAPAASRDETWTAEEITAQTGASPKLLDELAAYGLIHPHVVGGTTTFDAMSRQIAALAVEFAGHGLEVRHLRIWRTNAEKETALFEQLILPLVRQRNPQARQQTVATLSSLCDLGADLRDALIRSELKPYLD